MRDLRQVGIQPDFLICRAEREIPKELKSKIALFCNVATAHVFESTDCDSIYKIPMYFHNQGLDQKIVDHLNIWTRSPDLSQWSRIESRIDRPKHELRVGIVGKYTGVVDSYKSIFESLIHAGISNEAKVYPEYIDAEALEFDEVDKLDKYHAVIVPGGFGGRGIEGKINAIKYLRENKIPFLGICLGMQLAAIEFARNVLMIEDATSIEFDERSPNPIIHYLEDQKEVTKKGGTMRLGAYPCRLENPSQAYSSYGSLEVSERHRHRFEFNLVYKSRFEENGVVFSGLSPDGELVEIIEVKNHPFFVACQFHPELKSRPTDSHPLFRDLVKAGLTREVVVES